jgi:hypothetical protein
MCGCCDHRLVVDFHCVGWDDDSRRGRAEADGPDRSVSVIAGIDDQRRILDEQASSPTEQQRHPATFDGMTTR